MQKLRHVGIVVDNMGKADFFYRNLLGLEFVDSKLEIGDYPNDLLGLKTLLWAKYKTKEGDIVELYELPRGNNNFSHISFTVHNISQVVKKLKSFKFFCSQITQADKKKPKVAFCRDKDGNLIELVEEVCEKIGSKKRKV